MNLLQKLNKNYVGRYFLYDNNVPFTITKITADYINTKWWSIKDLEWKKGQVTFKNFDLEFEISKQEYDEKMKNIYKATIEFLGDKFKSKR